MEKTSKHIVLRLLIAVCFLWLPVNGARAFLASKTYLSGEPLAIVLGLAPVIAGLFIFISALVDSRIGIGIGAILYVLYQGYAIYVYYMNMQQQGLPDEAKKSFRSLIISTGLIILAFLILALACFIERIDIALCIIAAILFVVWFFVSRSGAPADQPQLQRILTTCGSVLGTILMAMFFAVKKKKA